MSAMYENVMAELVLSQGIALFLWEWEEIEEFSKNFKGTFFYWEFSVWNIFKVEIIMNFIHYRV